MDNTNQTTELQQENLPNPFQEGNWQEAGAPQQALQSQQPSVEQKKQQEEQIAKEEKNPLKTYLGYEDWETAKSEIEKLKETPKFDFENEESRKIYDYLKDNKEDELFSFLSEKRKVDKLVNSEVKDINTASDIIKLNMLQKNKELTQDEIDFLFNKQYSIPEKPVQAIDELDEDFEARVASYENKLQSIEKEILIQAKLAKPELEKIKSSLSLPDLYPKQTAEEPTQEELEAKEKYFGNLRNAVSETIKSFDGFQATVKDEEGEFAVNYVPSEEERSLVAEQIDYFVENDLDANYIFAERWVNEDGTINVKQMTKDLLLIQNEGKINQKFVNEAANRRLTSHLRKQSNIVINNESNNGTFSPDNYQSEMDKLAAIMFAK